MYWSVFDFASIRKSFGIAGRPRSLSREGGRSIPGPGMGSEMVSGGLPNLIKYTCESSSRRPPRSRYSARLSILPASWSRSLSVTLSHRDEFRKGRLGVFLRGPLTGTPPFDHFFLRTRFLVVHTASSLRETHDLRWGGQVPPPQLMGFPERKTVWTTKIMFCYKLIKKGWVLARGLRICFGRSSIL